MRVRALPTIAATKRASEPGFKCHFDWPWGSGVVKPKQKVAVPPAKFQIEVSCPPAMEKVPILSSCAHFQIFPFSMLHCERSSKVFGGPNMPFSGDWHWLADTQ